ncbi:MAG: cytochrome c556 [Gammaproteobacteria bacterium]|jgi:cytochrome c556
MKPLVLTSTILISVLASTTLFADTKAAIKHRQGIMEAIGGHFNASIGTLGGPAEFMPNHTFHAQSIADLAKIAPKVFAPGTGEGKTKAKESIWSKPDEFKEKMDDFVTNANALAVASNSSDMSAYVGAVKNLGKTCKGCHDDFKKK